MEGETPVTIGATVNAIALLFKPPWLTTTLPVVAPPGTATEMLESDQLLTGAGWPLNVTTPAPCVDPKPLPEMMTEAPGDPLVADKPVITGAITVNATPLLCKPPAVTTTLPLAAPLGTVAVMLVSDHPEVEAVCPFKVTVPGVPVKWLPLIVMAAPGSPLEGVRLLMTGGMATVKLTPLLDTPPAAVTKTLPVLAPVGTTAVILVALQFMMVVAWVLPNVTNPLPCDGPKLEPAMTTDDPTAPAFGVRLLMLGAAVTVKLTPELATPPAAVITTLPVVAPVGTVAVMLVALQLVMVVAWVLPNVTNPLPCEGPKFDPAITIDEPTAPAFGVRLLILGAPVTVKETPVLAIPPAAVTTTLPVIAPAGTTAVMLVALQFVIDVAAVPLNFTLPLP